MIRTMTIIEALEWAFQRELPKETAGGGGFGAPGQSSSWGMVADFGVLGTVIDAPVNTWGVVPVMDRDEAPHADAVTLASVLRDVARRATVRVPDGWFPFPGWADARGLVRAEIDRVRPRLERTDTAEILALVAGSAVLGRAPAWEGAVEPGERMVARSGRPAWFMMETGVDGAGAVWSREVDGRCPKTRRPRAGAYRKYELTESVAGEIRARFDRALWALVLAAVAEAAKPRLEAVSLVSEPLRAEPWHDKPCHLSIFLDLRHEVDKAYAH